MQEEPPPSRISSWGTSDVAGRLTLAVVAGPTRRP